MPKKEFKIKDYTEEKHKPYENTNSDTGHITTGIGKNYMQSDNYVPDTSGWKIWGDGTAEFGNGKFRGSFEIGGATKTISTIDEVQPALDELSTTGGTLYLKSGTYELSADISIPAGVVLEGVSRDGVILDCNNDYKIKMIGSDAYSTGDATIGVGDTEVVGNGTTWTAAMIGRHIMLDGYYYEITARTDNTHINISPAYFGTALTNASYVLATINISPKLKKVTIIDGSTPGNHGLFIQYAKECIVDDVTVDACDTAIGVYDTLYASLLVSCFNSTEGILFDNCWGSRTDYSELSFNSVGFKATDSGALTFTDSAINENTGNGMELTNCSNMAFISINYFTNGDNGIELISGCDRMQFIAVECSDNTNDGITLTATSDNNSIGSCVFVDNGGYGISIMASTCDNNQISVPAFSGNVTGELYDNGTNTYITPETELYASDTLRFSSDVEKNTTSNAYAKIKEIVLNKNYKQLRIKFNGYRAGAFATYGRIYKNGVALGTEQTLTAVDTVFSEDLGTFAAGDLLQIYAKSAGGTAYAYNFRLYYDEKIVPIVNFTTQDP